MIAEREVGDLMQVNAWKSLLDLPLSWPSHEILNEVLADKSIK